jgi:hypothetical protein
LCGRQTGAERIWLGHLDTKKQANRSMLGFCGVVRLNSGGVAILPLGIIAWRCMLGACC